MLEFSNLDPWDLMWGMHPIMMWSSCVQDSSESKFSIIFKIIHGLHHKKHAFGCPCIDLHYCCVLCMKPIVMEFSVLCEDDLVPKQITVLPTAWYMYKQAWVQLPAKVSGLFNRELAHQVEVMLPFSLFVPLPLCFLFCSFILSCLFLCSVAVYAANHYEGRDAYISSGQQNGSPR